MGHIDDEHSARFHYPRKLLDETAVVLYVLQKVYDYNQIEVIVGKFRRSAVELMDLVTHHVLYRGHDVLIQIGAVPFATTLPQEVAQHSIVGADIQTDHAAGVGQQFLDGRELCFLQGRLLVQAEQLLLR
jgi:hypothetical protein